MNLRVTATKLSDVGLEACSVEPAEHLVKLFAKKESNHRHRELLELHRLPDRYVRQGGRLALVLPRSALSGVAWRPTRELIARNYDLEYVVVSHEPDHWNFSDTTELSEVLIVARKRVEGEPSRRTGKFVNLWRNPRNAIEALTLHRLITKVDPVEVGPGTGVASITVGGMKYGEMVRVPENLSVDQWSMPCAFAQTALLRWLFELGQGHLTLPGGGDTRTLPLCQLSVLGTLGPDPRDVYDAFQITEAATDYPALWGAKGIYSLSQEPNLYLEPLARARPGRHLRRVDDLWPKAARVLLIQRPWLNTKAVTAVRMSRKVLADVWWPLVLRGRSGDTEQREKALVVWLNSTPALILLLGRREETRGAWIQFKKPALESLPVLDLNAISAAAITRLAAVFDEIAAKALRPFPQMASDQVRARVDAAVALELGLPTLDGLRETLSREAIFSLSMARLTPTAPNGDAVVA